MAAKKPVVLTSGEYDQIQPGDYVDIPNGGTGATSAASARAALGLEIGAQVQAYSANLDGYAALGVSNLLAFAAAYG